MKKFTNQQKSWHHDTNPDQYTNNLQSKYWNIHRKSAKSQSCHLKIRLDLPPEMAKCNSRSVNMNNNALYNCERKPCHLGTV